jgi:PRMT5 arginine-N-methyltransferase
MNQRRSLLVCAACLLAVLAGNPSLQAAKKKQAATKKEHTEKAPVQAQSDRLQENVEREIAKLKDDVYTRATWKALQEVKQQTDDTAGKMRMVMVAGGGCGFVLGCIVTALVVRRMGKSDDALKIT